MASAIGLVEVVVFTRGVAQNTGVKWALEKAFGVDLFPKNHR